MKTSVANISKPLTQEPWRAHWAGEFLARVACFLCLLLSSCALVNDPRWRATGSVVATKLGAAVAKIVINSAVQSLSGHEQADFLDSAAAGLRTLPGTVSSDDVEAIVKIWTTPPGESTPPEMTAAAKKIATVKAPPEVLAESANHAATIVRANSKTP
jgi:hypothetical protein